MGTRTPVEGDIVTLTVGSAVREFVVHLDNHDGTLELVSEDSDLTLDFVPVDWVTVKPKPRPLKVGDTISLTWSPTCPLVTAEELPVGIVIRGLGNKITSFKDGNGCWQCDKPKSSTRAQYAKPTFGSYEVLHVTGEFLVTDPT